MPRNIKSITNKIKDLLFGDYADSLWARGQSREPTPPLPLDYIINDLKTYPDDQWVQYAFSRDPLQNKVSADQKKEIGLLARSCGEYYFKRMLNEVGKENISDIEKYFGLNVQYPHMPQNTDRVLFAEFREPNNINIFMDGVEKGQELLENKTIRIALGGYINIKKILFGHELFHYLEFLNKKDIWTQNYKVDLINFIVFKHRSRLRAASELAAMAFTKKFCKLQFSAYILDVFLTYAYSPSAATALYNQIKEIMQ